MIDEECLFNAVELVRPPFFINNKQLSPVDAEQTRSIARARVHVGCVIQRVKQFSVLKNKLLWSMLIPDVEGKGRNTVSGGRCR